MRANWEHGFAALVTSDLLPSPRETAMVYKESQAEGHIKRTLALKINEREEREPCELGRLSMRYAVQPSLRLLGDAVVGGVVGVGKNPLLRMFVDHRERVTGVRHLVALMEWPKSFQRLLAFRMTRGGAIRCSVEEFLRGKSAEESARLRLQFDSFASSWNSVRTFVTRFRCREFRDPIPLLDSSPSLALCLLEKKDAGAFLCGMIERLVESQNAFLGAVREAVEGLGGECPPHLWQLRGYLRAAPEKPVGVHMCGSVQVICATMGEVEALVERHSMAGLGYGEGQDLEYDLVAIERHLATSLVANKCHLTMDDMSEMEYEGEMFSRHATILSSVSNRTSQLPLSSDALQIITAELARASIGVGHLLATLNLCLEFLRKTGGDPGDLLIAYSSRWLEGGVASVCHQVCLREVQLRHVVALYEGLEDCISKNIQSYVHSKYNCHLPEDVKAKLINVVNFSDSLATRAGSTNDGVEQASPSQVSRIPKDCFASVLKRFMFRYLTTESQRRDDPMKFFLTDSRLAVWPPGSPSEEELEDLLPDSLLLEHALGAYRMLTSV